jgi:hypothetical protein
MLAGRGPLLRLLSFLSSLIFPHLVVDFRVEPGFGLKNLALNPPLNSHLNSYLSRAKPSKSVHFLQTEST